MEKVPGRNHKEETPLPLPPDDPHNTQPVGIWNCTIAWDHDMFCHWNAVTSELFETDMLENSPHRDMFPMLVSKTQEPVFEEEKIKDVFMEAFWIYVRTLYAKYRLQAKRPTAEQRKARRDKDNRRKRCATVSHVQRMTALGP